jgi:hypothetical protein
MAAQRQAAQVEHVVGWWHQARGSPGRWQPPLSGGRDGGHVPLGHGAWKAGAPAPGSGLDRGGKRRGTGSLGQMPESGQGPRTPQWTALLQDGWSHVDRHGLRLVYVSDDGDHPSDDSHAVLRQRHDPRRPWRQLEWRRMIDYYHACLYGRVPPGCGSFPSLKKPRKRPSYNHAMRAFRPGIASFFLPTRLPRSALVVYHAPRLLAKRSGRPTSASIPARLAPPPRAPASPNPWLVSPTSPPAPPAPRPLSPIPHPPVPRHPASAPPQGRRRQVDTSGHGGPAPDWASRGGRGLGKRRATGHPHGGPWRPRRCSRCGGDCLATQGPIVPGKRVAPHLLVWAIGT